MAIAKYIPKTIALIAVHGWMLYNLPMVFSILATKLYIPPLPTKLVPRTSLIQRLNDGLAARRKLTLISAPAGFGKSTLVNEWIKQSGQESVWLSLDQADQNPSRFLSYLIGALQKIRPALGGDLLSALQSPQPPYFEALQTAFLNEIAGIPNSFILVLDDYHLVASEAIDSILAFFVEHSPPQMQIVLTTREDPVLPIPRLRARNQLTEIRAADLRFLPSETAEFLNYVMELDLSGEEIAALETRTEGWVAGLQLAALSLRGQADVQTFIQTFTGDHRYILDYLSEEVLRHQPEDVRNFLLQTSILDRLSAPLCDAVTSQAESKTRLESLLRNNLFLIPLDDKHHWYRYHHLFADVLRTHLMTDLPGQVPGLHQRASEWYENSNLMTAAIDHALAAQNMERAADLIERATPEMRRNRQESTLLGWLQRLPEALFTNRPMLNIHYVWTLLSTGQLEHVESRLQQAEQWLEKPADLQTGMVVADELEFRRLPGLSALYHAAYSMAIGRINDTVKYAQQALERVEEADHLGHGAALSLLGLALWAKGDLNAAEQSYKKGIPLLQQAKYHSDAIGCILTLADIQIMQGHLLEAMGTYKQGLQIANSQDALVLRGAADMYVGMSELQREKNDLDSAEQLLLKSEQLGEFAGLPQNRYRWRVALAGIRQGQGKFDEALELLEAAERLYMGDLSPNVYPIPAIRARVWIKQGSLGEAKLWAHENDLSSADELNMLREFEQITLTRILIAQPAEKLRDALQLLERLLSAAEAGGRNRSVIEVCILQALANQIKGDGTAALNSLEHALNLAEPEGYIRIFLDEGKQMEVLLRKYTSKNESGYAGKLLSAFESEHGLDEEPPRFAGSASASLIEPLSPRELDILRLFKSDLSGPEIAQELVVALSTVRTHTKSIYNKLNVNNRRAAVRRAIELGLI